jgi:hypothetical protein
MQFKKQGSIQGDQSGHLEENHFYLKVIELNSTTQLAMNTPVYEDL